MVYATNSAGYQALPTEQPLAEELYANAPLSYGDIAARNYARQRAAAFGSRGEMSYDLDQINQLEDFNYSPQATGYLDTLYGAMNANRDYNLTPMHGIGSAPLTSQQIEALAARGSPESQLYANFNLSAPGGEWDAGNLQFDPSSQYRLIDRSTGDTLYSGTGYEAGKNISQMANDLYSQSGQKANWAIESAGADGDWQQRYDHDPDTSGFMNFLLMAAPFAALSALPALGLAGAGSAGGAAGAASAHAGMSAALGAGGIANAAPGLAALGAGVGAGAAGLAAPTLGAGALGSVAAPITVVGAPAAGGISAGTLAGTGLATGLGAASGLTGSPVNSAATQNLPDDIVVSGTPAAGTAGLGQSLATGAALTGGAAAALPGAGTTSGAAADGQNPSTLSQISKYLELAGYGSGLLGNLFGGGGGTGANGTVPGGFGSLNPVFSGALPAANLPGVGNMTPRVMPQQDWNTYAMRPEQSFFNNVPQNVQGFADGGDVRGPGTGRSDSIPAALSDGEYVFDAETVALLGDGSTDAGADLLDKFRINIRKHKGKHLSKGEISPNAKAPEHYLAGGLA